MTAERCILVRLPDEPRLQALTAGIRAAAARVAKAAPGDRTDVVRYEALSSQLERAARLHSAQHPMDKLEVVPARQRSGHSFFDSATADLLPPGAEVARGWVAAGDLVVELRQLFGRGETIRDTVDVDPQKPLEPWESLDAEGRPLFGTAAIADRFRIQIEAALGGKKGAAINPSGVPNRVLTEGLRKFVSGDDYPVSVPVVYKDGSTGPDFALRSVPFQREAPVGWRIFRFALLSIRHTEMDVAVDGAWFRNTEISRPRPAGQTDELAFEISKEQLRELCRTGPAVIHLYQTGLHTAIVGFYRAVTLHLMHQPGTIAVVPMYFRRSEASDDASGLVKVYTPQSKFGKGTPWIA